MLIKKQLNFSNFDLVGYADAEYLSYPHKQDLKQVVFLQDELLYLGNM